MKQMTHDDGYRRWFDEEGLLHREDGPALIRPDGIKIYYRHGKAHRDGAPAMMVPNGDQGYFQNNQLHREDGPAIERTGTDGQKEIKWCLNDEFYTFDEWIDKLAETSKTHAADMKAVWANYC